MLKLRSRYKIFAGTSVTQTELVSIINEINSSVKWVNRIADHESDNSRGVGDVTVEWVCGYIGRLFRHVYCTNIPGASEPIINASANSENHVLSICELLFLGKTAVQKPHVIYISWIKLHAIFLFSCASQASQPSRASKLKCKYTLHKFIILSETLRETKAMYDQSVRLTIPVEYSGPQSVPEPGTIQI